MTEQELIAAREANERCQRAEQHLEDVRFHWKLQTDLGADDLFEAAFSAALEQCRVAYIARAVLQGASESVSDAAWQARRFRFDSE
jgi:hypothetical protein